MAKKVTERLDLKASFKRISNNAETRKQPMMGELKGRTRIPMGESMLQDGDLLIFIGDNYILDSQNMGKNPNTNETIYADFAYPMVVSKNGKRVSAKQVYFGSVGREVQEWDPESPVTDPVGNGVFHHAGGDLVYNGESNLWAAHETNEEAFNACFKGKIVKVHSYQKKQVLKFTNGVQKVGNQTMYDFNEATADDLKAAGITVNGDEVSIED